MLEPKIADSVRRHGVDRMLFWVERDRPGVYARWWLDHEKPIVLPPGIPLDTLLCPEAFKIMFIQHLKLHRSINADLDATLAVLMTCGLT